MNPADELQQRIETAKRWPIPAEQPIVEQVARYRAHREADSRALRPYDWDDGHHRRNRPYLVDPLPARISGAFADLIFGEDPTFIAAADADQPALDELVEVNDLPTSLQHAADVSVSEGEVWWRVLIDQDAATMPLIEWHSRLNVVPLLRSGRVLACAFVSEIVSPTPERQDCVRYVELHAPGLVRNLVFAGRSDSIGQRVSLGSHEETADLPEEWPHGLPMLAGRIINAQGPDRRVGKSQYHGVTDLFMALNETTSVGQENMRLTAKKRAVIPQAYLDEFGRFPAGAEILVDTGTDRDPDKAGTGIAQVEWSFDAAALELYRDGQVDTVLTRCRCAPQLVGRHTENAQTGPSLRARLLDSVLAANGMGRAWDDQVPKMLSVAARAAALPVEQGGLGAPWADPTGLPSMERTSALPEDEDEKVQRHTTAVAAEIESRETAIRDLRPEWDEKQVRDELRRISDENQVAPIAPPPTVDLNGRPAETS